MKTGRRIIGMLLAVVMIVSCVSFDTISAYAKSKNKDKDISELIVGDKSNGFTLTAVSDEKTSDAKIYIFEHDKTGAEVYLVKNDDPEKAFSIYFKTYAEDDKGKPHIIEHSVLSSTEKYPGRDVFFDVCNTAYITYSNASTSKAITYYPVSSLDEEELLSYSDYYLDGVFNPMVKKDDRIFKSEGFRYILSDKDAPLEVNGVVYNEMVGSYSDIKRYVFDGISKTLYGGNYNSYESGGYPNSILELSYEELIDFYDRYYHPSNCMVVLYGDVDYVKWLKKLDNDYFSKYERKEFADPERPVPKGDSGIVYVDFPAEEGTMDLNGEMSYVWDLSDDLNSWEIEALNIFAGYDISQGTAFRDELDASGIALNYSSYVLILGDQCVFCVSASNADTTRAEDFKNIIDRHLKNVSKKSVNKELLNSIYESEKLNKELEKNSANQGIGFINTFGNAILAYGKDYFLNEAEYSEKEKELVTSGKVVKLFKTNVVKNKNKVLIVVAPKPGLAEENEMALEQKLTDFKASLSDEEINALIESTIEFDEWNVTGTPQETLDKIVNAKSSDIEIVEPEYDTFVKEVDGVTVYAASNDSEAALYKFDFDISNFSKKELKALNEYLAFMGALSTKNRDINQISYELSSYLSGLQYNIVAKKVNGKEIPMLQISFYALPENLDNALDLALDLLYNTDLEANADLVYMYLSYFQSMYYDADADFDTFYLSAAANSSYGDRLDWELHGIPSFLYLTKTISNEKNFSNFIKYVGKARNKAAKRQNGLIRIVAPEDRLEEGIEKLLSAFPSKNKTYKDGSALKLSAVPKKTGVIMNTSTSYLFLGASSDDDLKTIAARMVLSHLIEDNIYVPQFRFEMGTYTPMCQGSPTGAFISALYRSPSPIEQYEIMLQMPEYVLELLDYVTEEDIEGYKLSLISTYTCPNGDFNMAEDRLGGMQLGYNRNPNFIIAENIKNLTVEDLKEAAKDLNKFYDEGTLLVVGPSSEIKAHKDLFDKIYKIQ